MDYTKQEIYGWGLWGLPTPCCQVLYILSKGLVMLNKKVGAYGEVWGEDFVLSDAWCMACLSAYGFISVSCSL